MENKKQILVVGFPRGGTSMLAAYLKLIGLNTVEDDREKAAYPAGFNEHMPILLFNKACERLRGQRNRLTDQALIESGFLDIPGMNEFFEAAYAPLIRQEVDFLKIPDLALALEFIAEKLPHVHILAVWRKPRVAMESFFRREFGKHPGFHEAFYSIGTWNLFAERVCQFKRSHSDRIDILSIDGIIEDSSALLQVLDNCGHQPEHALTVADTLTKPLRSDCGMYGRLFPLLETISRRLVKEKQKTYFETDRHLKELIDLSV